MNMPTSKAHELKWNTAVRNFLLDDLARLDLNGAQANILFKMQRLTYGFEEDAETGRRHDRVALSQKRISEMTGLSLRTIEKAMTDLIERNIITVHAEGIGRKPATFGINSNTDEWQGLRPADTKPTRRSTERIDGTKRVVPNKKTVLEPAEPTFVPNESTVLDARSTERIDGTHVLKKDLKKIPPTPQGVDTHSPLRFKDEALGLTMWRMIAQMWFPNTGAPASFQTNACSLTEQWRDNLELLTKIFREKLAEQKKEWDEKGERCKYPWTIFNDVSVKMSQLGLKPCPPRPKEQHWVDGDAVDFKFAAGARGQPRRDQAAQPRRKREWFKNTA